MAITFLQNKKELGIQGCWLYKKSGKDGECGYGHLLASGAHQSFNMGF
jgi:hypothetical protein